MHWVRRSISVAGAVIAVGGLAACGGHGDNADTTTKTTVVTTPVATVATTPSSKTTTDAPDPGCVGALC